MSGKTLPLAVLMVIALCLIKLSFFSSEKNPGLVSQAHAEGAIVEWNKSTRMVSSGDNGSTAFVWDFTGKTALRKYYIENDKLKMKVYELEN